MKTQRFVLSFYDDPVCLPSESIKTWKDILVTKSPAVLVDKIAKRVLLYFDDDVAAGPSFSMYKTAYFSRRKREDIKLSLVKTAILAAAIRLNRLDVNYAGDSILQFLDQINITTNTFKFIGRIYEDPRKQPDSLLYSFLRPFCSAVKEDDYQAGDILRDVLNNISEIQDQIPEIIIDISG